jgi:hypothetical protein
MDDVNERCSSSDQIDWSGGLVPPRFRARLFHTW